MSGKRVLAVYAALLLGFMVVLCRLYLLAQHPAYAARAAAQSTVTLQLPARRGKFKGSAELECFEDAVSGNTTIMVKMLIPLIQAVMGGDIEALFLLLRVLGQEPGTPGQFGINPYTPSASAADAPSVADSHEGIHIHLLRGEKPTAPPCAGTEEEQHA